MAGSRGAAGAPGRPAVVALPAEIDLTSASRVSGRLGSALASGVTVVVADMTATTFCDSAGARVLVDAWGQAAANNVELRLVVPPAVARRGLALMGLPGPNRGNLYCSWMDQTPANGTDIFLSRSTDGGSTWSAPLRVNDDPTGVANDQCKQWLSVDPSDGSVNLSWNDTRNDPAHLSTDIFYARSTDGGLSFTKNVQVTTAPTNETCCGADLGNQYGDYEGVAAMDGSIHPVWTDRRAAVASLDEEIFTATLTVR